MYNVPSSVFPIAPNGVAVNNEPSYGFPIASNGVAVNNEPCYGLHNLDWASVPPWDMPYFRSVPPSEILYSFPSDSENDSENDNEDAFQPTNTDDCVDDLDTSYVPEFVDSDNDEGDLTMSMLSNQVEGILNRSYLLRSSGMDRTGQKVADDGNEMEVEHSETTSGEVEMEVQHSEITSGEVEMEVQHSEITSGGVVQEVEEADCKSFVKNIINGVIESVFKKKNISKKRPRSDTDKVKRNAEKHPVLSPCQSCNLKCSLFITEDRRKEINEEYWALSHDNQVAWVFATTTNEKVKRHRVESQNKRSRNYSKTYFLKDDANEMRNVCAVMYRRTLGHAHDSFVKTIFAKAADTKTLPSPDKRGRHAPHNKLTDEDVESIKKHIFSFNPSLPHYRYKHAPNRLYLPSDLNISQMHNDYNATATRKVSYSVYERKLNEFNISFAKLGVEDCDDCVIQKLHVENDHSGENVPQPEGICIYPQICKTCIEFDIHERTAESCRIEYKKDADISDTPLIQIDTMYCTVDMQKVIMLPRMPGSKTAIFTKRMVVFHETFAPMGSFEENKPVGVIWNESITGRIATDLASTFTQYIRTTMALNPSIKHFTLWADNCAGQNKNWTLYTALVAEVNALTGPTTVTIKYFQPGHTYMSADAFHRIVEHRMKKVKNVFDFDEFVDIINFRGEALEMQYFDFTSYPKGMSTAKFASQKPKLDCVREIQFHKGSENMFWRQAFGKELKSAPFLMKKISREIMKGNISFFHKKDSPRGMQSAKQKDIVSKLCPMMKSSKNKKYWMELPNSDDVVDLADKREDVYVYVYKD